MAGGVDQQLVGRDLVSGRVVGGHGERPRARDVAQVQLHAVGRPLLGEHRLAVQEEGHLLDPRISRRQGVEALHAGLELAHGGDEVDGGFAALQSRVGLGQDAGGLHVLAAPRRHRRHHVVHYVVHHVVHHGHGDRPLLAEELAGVDVLDLQNQRVIARPQGALEGEGDRAGVCRGLRGDGEVELVAEAVEQLAVPQHLAGQEEVVGVRLPQGRLPGGVRGHGHDPLHHGAVLEPARVGEVQPGGQGHGVRGHVRRVGVEGRDPLAPRPFPARHDLGFQQVPALRGDPGDAGHDLAGMVEVATAAGQGGDLLQGVPAAADAAPAGAAGATWASPSRSLAAAPAARALSPCGGRRRLISGLQDGLGEERVEPLGRVPNPERPRPPLAVEHHGQLPQGLLAPRVEPDLHGRKDQGTTRLHPLLRRAVEKQHPRAPVRQVLERLPGLADVGFPALLQLVARRPRQGIAHLPEPLDEGVPLVVLLQGQEHRPLLLAEEDVDFLDPGLVTLRELRKGLGLARRDLAVVGVEGLGGRREKDPKDRKDRKDWPHWMPSTGSIHG